MNIELHKTYRTRSGQKCRIICMDAHHCFPIVGLIQEASGEHAIQFRKDGSIMSAKQHIHDLISEWVDKPTIDRSILPAWANKAAAMDASGKWYCFPDIPSCATEAWAGNGNHRFIPSKYAPKWEGDWKDSLIVWEDK